MFNWNWDQTGIFRKLVLNESVGTLDLTLVRYLGFVHLVTESGIHLYALIGVSLAFWKGIAWASSLRIRTAWLLGCLTGFGFCMAAWWLSDWRVGLFRPLVSVTVRMIAQVLGLRFQWFGPLLVALVADVLLLGERSQSGRLHYACAVAGGLWVWKQVSRSRFSHLKMAIVSWFATAGLDAWELGIVSTLTPLWSLITIPLFAGICFPLLLLAKLGVFYSETLFEWMHSMMMLCLKIAFAFPGLVVISKERLIAACLFGFFASFLTIRWRWGMLGLMVVIQPFLTAENFMIQKNVGQGDAFIMRQENVVTMIDTGDRKIRDSDWMKFFFSHQVTEIQQILFTHLDSDHASGVKRLERLIPIGECWIDSRHLTLRQSPCSYAPTVDPVSSREMSVFTATNGSHKKGNDVMTGVWIHSSGVDYLNLGDAASSLEWRLYQGLRVSPLSLPHRILKVTHHGSRYSLSPQLLKSYQPTQAWISVGPRNRYGHPSQHAMSLLTDYGIPISRTDVKGDLR